MSTEIWAAICLVVSPVWFNVTFAVLAKRFDYPGVLREPAGWLRSASQTWMVSNVRPTAT